jgi:dihydrofolate reductase
LAEKGFASGEEKTMQSNGTMKSISLIAAMDKNRVIGDNGKLPWHLPADLRNFKTVTLGKPVIMGRKTFESIGAPLPERLNIVITRNKNYEAPGCVVVYSPDDALKAAGDAPEIMVIGGAEVFTQFLPQAQRMHLTLIDGVFSGTAYFPQWDSKQWRIVSREAHESDEKNLYGYAFCILERVQGV